jgi:hypothetical protein
VDLQTNKLSKPTEPFQVTFKTDGVPGHPHPGGDAGADGIKYGEQDVAVTKPAALPLQEVL